MRAPERALPSPEFALRTETGRCDGPDRRPQRVEPSGDSGRRATVPAPFGSTRVLTRYCTMKFASSQVEPSRRSRSSAGSPVVPAAEQVADPVPRLRHRCLEDVNAALCPLEARRSRHVDSVDDDLQPWRIGRDAGRSRGHSVESRATPSISPAESPADGMLIPGGPFRTPRLRSTQRLEGGSASRRRSRMGLARGAWPRTRAGVWDPDSRPEP